MEPPPESPPGPPQRSRRLRLACARCQKRKIRCDGQYPTCNNCKRASAVCSDGESLRLRSVVDPNDEIVAGLHQRVAQLEATLEERNRSVAALRGAMADLHGSHAAPAGSASVPAVPGGGDMPENSGNAAMSHEIGLISVGSSSAPRYLGPSSGYFLSRMLFKSTRPLGGGGGAGAAQEGRPLPVSGSMPAPLLDGTESAPAAASLPSKARAVQLVDAFFDTIAPQYPVLHRPSFMRGVDALYAETSTTTGPALTTVTPRTAQAESKDPVLYFQTYLVLAFGGSILSQLKHATAPVEEYCVAAMQYFDALRVESASLPTLQSLVLLLVFALHNPHFRLNVWHLNYHCIAMLIDLGLQRNITHCMPPLEEQMRTRLFWVVFTLDRTIATIMGRPIGLRDEACELRYPSATDDDQPGVVDADGTATADAENQPSLGPPITDMTYAIHLFKLARLNSEIKYVANSIVRDTPLYAYPPPTNIYEWQRSTLGRLEAWCRAIPRAGRVGGMGGHTTEDLAAYMAPVCELRYHSLVILLTRPSPAIQHPTDEALQLCYHSCKASILLYDRLYRDNRLLHSWPSFHGLLLSIVTLLYCIRASPCLASRLEVEGVVLDVCKGLNLLSAAGEHWPGAKRCRNIFDDLLPELVRWIKQAQQAEATGAQNNNGGADPAHQGSAIATAVCAPATTIHGSTCASTGMNDAAILFPHADGTALAGNMDDWMGEDWELLIPANLDDLMHNFFVESPL